MTATELINTAHITRDAKGAKVIQIDLAIWQKIIELLEELEDAEDFARARQEEDEFFTLEEVVAEYEAAHPEVANV
jgi:hypothetical protein